MSSQLEKNFPAQLVDMNIKVKTSSCAVAYELRKACTLTPPSLKIITNELFSFGGRNLSLGEENAVMMKSDAKTNAEQYTWAGYCVYCLDSRKVRRR